MKKTNAYIKPYLRRTPMFFLRKKLSLILPIMAFVFFSIPALIAQTAQPGCSTPSPDLSQMISSDEVNKILTSRKSPQLNVSSCHANKPMNCIIFFNNKLLTL